MILPGLTFMAELHDTAMESFLEKRWLHQWNVDLSANTFLLKNFVHNTVNVTQTSFSRRIFRGAFTCSGFLLSLYPLFDG